MSDTTLKDTNQELQQDLNRAKRDAADFASVARERGREQLEGAKSQVAEGAERIADAVERTADELEGDGDELVSGYGRSLATMMRQLAGGLRERDVDEFARELSSFARQHPGAFLAGSVALGFGISRFLKASGRHGYDDSYDSYPPDDSYDAVDPFGLDRDDHRMRANASDSRSAPTGDGEDDDQPLPGDEPLGGVRPRTARGATTESRRGETP
jgi:hypothetical protein